MVSYAQSSLGPYTHLVCGSSNCQRWYYTQWKLSFSAEHTNVMNIWYSKNPTAYNPIDTESLVWQTNNLVASHTKHVVHRKTQLHRILWTQLNTERLFQTLAPIHGSMRVAHIELLNEAMSRCGFLFPYHVNSDNRAPKLQKESFYFLCKICSMSSIQRYQTVLKSWNSALYERQPSGDIYAFPLRPRAGSIWLPT